MEASRALGVAEAYLAEGRVIESVAFLEKAGAGEKLREIREQAVQAGDVFLLRELSLRLAEEPDASTWRVLAEAAEAQGKVSYAVEARRQLSILGG